MTQDQDQDQAPDPAPLGTTTTHDPRTPVRLHWAADLLVALVVLVAETAVLTVVWLTTDPVTGTRQGDPARLTGAGRSITDGAPPDTWISLAMITIIATQAATGLFYARAPISATTQTLMATALALTALTTALSPTPPPHPPPTAPTK